jgi:hypothetical protein
MHGHMNVKLAYIQGVPLATEPGWLADRCSVSQQLGALKIHTTDTFFFISHTTNVPLFKFRCIIFIGVRIIKEMPVSVASGTSCRFVDKMMMMISEIYVDRNVSLSNRSVQKNSTRREPNHAYKSGV